MNVRFGGGKGKFRVQRGQERFGCVTPFPDDGRCSLYGSPQVTKRTVPLFSSSALHPAGLLSPYAQYLLTKGHYLRKRVHVRLQRTATGKGRNLGLMVLLARRYEVQIQGTSMPDGGWEMVLGLLGHGA